MSQVNLTVINNTGLTVQCTDISCEPFENLNVGTELASGSGVGTGIYIASTNNRVFCTFKQVDGDGVWQLAMTNPDLTANSACGSVDAGLQAYNPKGTPAQFTFILGQPNQADWDNPNVNKGVVIPYGQCSVL